MKRSLFWSGLAIVVVELGLGVATVTLAAQQDSPVWVRVFFAVIVICFVVYALSIAKKLPSVWRKGW